ncbi:MAG: YihY/virulence factor BrkB family protein [Verrucomicrobiota bacterium]|nr:YihY/virulence factor BrkB family protein [Verrucomicrobiota bacterium]
MRLSAKGIWELFRDAAKDWMSDGAPRLGASLAFYTIFSLSPLFVIAIGLVGLVFDEELARQQVFSQVSGLLGEKGGEALQAIITNPEKETTGKMATIFATIMLIVGATGVFVQLQDALNIIWEVKQKPGQGIKGFIRHRLLSFAMVMSIGFLLLISLLVSAALAGMTKFMSGWFGGTEFIAQALNFTVSLAVITLLFAMIFKIMPDVKISWKDVWIGAGFTALLFTFGKFALGMYLGRSSVVSMYGAAGSLVIVLLWVYYSSQILFFGVELTQVYANRFGSTVEPSKHAIWDEDSCDVKPSNTAEAEGKASLAPAFKPIPKPFSAAAMSSASVVKPQSKSPDQFSWMGAAVLLLLVVLPVKKKP